MTSAPAGPLAGPLDAGLLSPVRAGVPVEAAVSDEAWLRAMLDAEAALARAQARLGAVPPSAAASITAVARTWRADVRAIAVAARETANPVVGLVRAFTAAVAEADPVAAEYVHRGSTSQDVLDTGAMLVADRSLRIVLVDLRRISAALHDLAGEHRDTLVAGRTLAVHAVPTTFGLKVAGWRQLVLDAEQRLEAVRAGGLPVSIGGAAGTLAGYLEYAGPGGDGTRPAPAGYADRLVDAFASETGLARPRLPWHSLRTPVADLAGALALTSGALGKIAADVLVMCRTEVAELAEPAGAGRGASSAMPHKRNPVLSTMIRSAALQVPSLSSVLVQCLVAEDERSAGVWHAEWMPLRECLRLTGGAAHTAVELVEGLRVDRDRMRANLDLTGGLVVSERLSAALAPLLGRDAARDLLTRVSAAAQERGLPLLAVLSESAGLRGHLDAAALADLCDPARYTGAAGALVDERAGSPR